MLVKSLITENYCSERRISIAALIKFNLLLLLISSCSHQHQHKDHDHHHHHHQPPRLAASTENKWIKRLKPLTVGQDIFAKSPHLAKSEDGKLAITVTNYDEKKDLESVWLYFWDQQKSALNPGVQISDGNRAWGARVGFDQLHRAWVVWCGGDLNQKSIWLRAASGGEKILISNQSGYQCAPNMVFDQGKFHITWEAGMGSLEPISKIYYRSFDPATLKSGKIVTVSSGHFDRRPVIAAHQGKIAIAWDRWINHRPSGAMDPDFDVFVRIKGEKGWEAIKTVDSSEGIQAAPTIAFNNSGDLLLSYHTTSYFDLVKFWTIKKLDAQGKLWNWDGDWPSDRPIEPLEMQGAEFPHLIIGPKQQIAVVSRPSHGHYLHLLDGKSQRGIDLDEEGWGARDLFHHAVFWDDSSIFIVRRGRKAVWLERLQLKKDLAAVSFVPAVIRPKPVAKKLISKSPTFPRPYDKFKLFYGDVHTHSGLSDGTGSPDEIYARSYNRGHDYAALTDHDNIATSRLFPSQHQEIAWTTDQFDKLSNFSTLHAYEWTTPPVPDGHGHQNVYFKTQPPMPLYNYRHQAPTTSELMKLLKQHQVFTAPHHTGWTGTVMEQTDPTILRHVEITSVHGAYEDQHDNPFKTRAAEVTHPQPGMFVRNFLQQGHEFGLIAGSDGHGLHHHHGMARHLDPWAHGLTGVYAINNSRKAIWQSLYDRQNFATSGQQIMIAFSMNGVLMGQSVESTSDQLQFQYQVQTTAPIVEVKLIKDGKETISLAKSGQGVYTDSCSEGKHSYYLRVVQQTSAEQLDMGWTSPIFVTCAKK